MKPQIAPSTRERAEVEFRDLLDSANDLVFILAADGRFLYFNRAFQSVLGYNEQELRALDIFDLLHPSCLEKCREHFQSLSTGAPQTTFETEFLTKDGRAITLEGNCNRGTGDAATQVIRGIFREITERKRTEEALRRSEEMYRALIEQAPDAIFISEPNLRFIDLNSRACELSGYRRDELLGMSITDLMPSEDFFFTAPRMDDLRRGKIVMIERRFRRRDGSLVPVEVRSKILSDGRLQAIVRDISERKRAEAALRESEARFRALIENSHDGIALFGADGAVLYASPSTAGVLGYTPEEVRQHGALEFVRPDWHDRVHEQLEESLRRPGVGIPVESYVRHKDGRWRFLEGIFTNLLDDPSVGAIVNNYRDITERRQTEAALRESEEQLRLFVEHAPAAIAMFDLEMRYLAASRRWLVDYGLQRADLRGLSHYEVFPEIDERWKEIHRRCLAGAVERADEDRFDRRDGTSQWLRWEVRPWHSASGAIGGIVIFSEDITERKRAEQELRASTEQLRALSGRLQTAREEEGTRIAREIHDELGAALTGLKWDLEGVDKLLSGAGDGSRAETLGQKISGMTSLIESTINTVRRISSELRPGVLDDLGLVAAIEWQAQQFQQRTGIVAICDACPDVGLTRERAIAVFRIFQEMLTNVLRHSGASSINVRTRLDNGSFVLEVRDNGRGITEEQKTNTRSLGLLGMRERAHLVGGEIVISGANGIGTTVTVNVPVE